MSPDANGFGFVVVVVVVVDGLHWAEWGRTVKRTPGTEILFTVAVVVVVVVVDGCNCCLL